MMEALGSPLDQEPRITALPGPSRLARVSEAAWRWVRAEALGEEERPGIGEEQIAELETVGVLVPAHEDEDALVLDRRWGEIVRSGLRTPVGIELVCIDGVQGWSTSLRVAGRVVLMVDQVHEVERDAATLRLGRRSSAVTLGLTTIEHLTSTVEALVPQRPAFTDAEPAPAAAELADDPAVAEVQMLVVSSPTREQTLVQGGSWYAHGEQGQELAVLTREAEGITARATEPGSLSASLHAHLMAAIDHVSAVLGPRGRAA